MNQEPKFSVKYSAALKDDEKAKLAPFAEKAIDLLIKRVGITDGKWMPFDDDKNRSLFCLASPDKETIYVCFSAKELDSLTVDKFEEGFMKGKDSQLSEGFLKRP